MKISNLNIFKNVVKEKQINELKKEKGRRTWILARCGPL
jgi:hypothetical protein